MVELLSHEYEAVVAVLGEARLDDLTEACETTSRFWRVLRERVGATLYTQIQADAKRRRHAPEAP